MLAFVLIGLCAVPQVVADEIPAARMRAVYEAVKTPCKAGMALVPAAGVQAVPQRISTIQTLSLSSLRR